jgi:hypothetical protein
VSDNRVITNHWALCDMAPLMPALHTKTILVAFSATLARDLERERVSSAFLVLAAWIEGSHGLTTNWQFAADKDDDHTDSIQAKWSDFHRLAAHLARACQPDTQNGILVTVKPEDKPEWEIVALGACNSLSRHVFKSLIVRRPS